MTVTGREWTGNAGLSRKTIKPKTTALLLVKRQQNTTGKAGQGQPDRDYTHHEEGGVSWTFGEH